MNLVITKTKTAITPDELRATHPEVSFPPDQDMNNEMLKDYGAAVLENDPYPDLAMLETIQPGKIRKEGGSWFRAWVIVPAAPEDVAAATTASFEEAIQSKMNEAAKAARYDSIATAVSYAEEPAVPKFQKDGIAFREWRSLVWAYAYEQLDLVMSGQRAQPTVDEFLLELPALELPV